MALEVGRLERITLPAPEEVRDTIEPSAVTYPDPPAPLNRPRPQRRAAARCDADRKAMISDLM